MRPLSLQVEWKHKRGKHRPRNLDFVKCLDAGTVEDASERALAALQEGKREGGQPSIETIKKAIAAFTQLKVSAGQADPVVTLLTLSLLWGPAQGTVHPCRLDALPGASRPAGQAEAPCVRMDAAAACFAGPSGALGHSVCRAWALPPLRRSWRQQTQALLGSRTRRCWQPWATRPTISPLRWR